MWPEWAHFQLVIHEVQVKLLYACVLSELLRVTTGSSWNLKGSTDLLVRPEFAPTCSWNLPGVNYTLEIPVSGIIRN